MDYDIEGYINDQIDIIMFGSIQNAILQFDEIKGARSYSDARAILYSTELIL